MSSDPLVVFTPSGKRGRFPVGTPVLTAARKLGVDLDSVCGGRGICSKCQVAPGSGEFSKHGIDHMIEYSLESRNFHPHALWMTIMAQEILRLRGVVEDAQALNRKLIPNKTTTQGD